MITTYSPGEYSKPLTVSDAVDRLVLDRAPDLHLDPRQVVLVEHVEADALGFGREIQLDRDGDQPELDGSLPHRSRHGRTSASLEIRRRGPFPGRRDGHDSAPWQGAGDRRAARASHGRDDRQRTAMNPSDLHERRVARADLDRVRAVGERRREQDLPAPGGRRPQADRPRQHAVDVDLDAARELRPVGNDDADAAAGERVRGRRAGPPGGMERSARTRRCWTSSTTSRRRPPRRLRSSTTDGRTGLAVATQSP